MSDAENNKAAEENSKATGEITPEVLQKALLRASPADRIKIEKLVGELSRRKKREEAQEDFLSFVRSQWPDFISGAHHRRIAKLFEAVAKGEKRRIIINLAPRHTKSEFASFLFPAWFLGKYPKKKIMQISNTAELAEGFGRKVRNLLETEEYREIFPDVELRSDSKAAGRWNTNYGGDYYATGVGAALAGRGADVVVIDDPHTENEALQAQFNPGIYDKVYEWFTTGPRQRLQPGGAIIVVQCMVGDTPVLMADKTEKPLRDIRPGDSVATFDNGRLTTSKVNNWRSSGVDSIYKVQTQSGKILRANERHPFLIMGEGGFEWVRINQLRVGDLLVSLKGATGKDEQRQNPESVDLVKQVIHTTANTQTPQEESRGITESTRGRLVLSLIVKSPSIVRGCVKIIMQKAIGLLVGGGAHQSSGINIGSNADTDSLLNSTKACSLNKMVDAPYVENCPEAMSGHIGAANCVLTIATTLEKFGVSSATTAISPLAMVRHQRYLNELRRISDFTADPIVSITFDGEEEVFDVEIDRTENFIANGVVSHNTRWSLRDLTGQILETASQREGADQWEVFEFPAILPSGNPLWPEYWSREMLEAIRAELPTGKWQAQYQQDPTSDENAIIKRADWQMWDREDPPSVSYIIMAMDTAFEAKKSADYSAAVFFGVWDNPEDGDQPNLILLNAWREKLEFPELKARTLEMYKEWEPDSVIIEKKASGAPLIAELRRMGIPVQEYTPSRGNDKITRLNAISDIFASGKVWAPNKRWADELIDEVASFPSGRYDDFVDCVSLALSRFRAGGFVGTQHDKNDYEDEWMYKSRRAAYY